MLIGNGLRLASNPGRLMAAPNALTIERSGWGKRGAIMNGQVGMDRQVRSDASRVVVAAVPAGYGPGIAWAPPFTAGALGTGRGLIGSGDLAPANLAGGRNAAATLTGSGDITQAALGLIVSAVAALSGSGTLNPVIVGKLEAAAALTGSGDITAALGALAGLTITLTGSGGASGAISATAALTADITVTGSGLNTANVAAAILDSPDAVEDGLTVREALRVIASALAGKVSGAGSSTITFRSAGADHKARITATVDGSGNRTTIVLDTED